MKARPSALCLLIACSLGCGDLISLAWGQNGASSPPATGVAPVGKVITASGTAHIEHVTAVVLQANLPSTGAGDAKVGALVYRGDIIHTGTDGTLGITFADGSAFSFSSNARMEVNEFIYDPKGHSNVTLISLFQGTFSLVSWAIAKTGDMKVDTPVGTVGIRGTAPRIEISNDGSA